MDMKNNVNGGNDDTVDYLNHVRKKNEGEKEQQYLQDHHPAIISQSDFVQVQLLLGRGIPVCVEL